MPTQRPYLVATILVMAITTAGTLTIFHFSAPTPPQLRLVGCTGLPQPVLPMLRRLIVRRYWELFSTGPRLLFSNVERDKAELILREIRLLEACEADEELRERERNQAQT